MVPDVSVRTSCFNAPGYIHHTTQTRKSKSRDERWPTLKVSPDASSSSSQCQTFPDPLGAAGKLVKALNPLGERHISIKDTLNNRLEPISEARLVEPDGIEPTTS